jgi:hypothetical protein
MTPTPLIDAEERERRLALLKTGALSDFTLRIGPVEKRLHAAIVSLRCGFLWRCLDPQATWRETHSRVLEATLPAALADTDGPWQEQGDLDAFFEWVYLAEAPPLPQPPTDEDVRRLFRLHRLAGFFGSGGIASAIESHITGHLLPAVAAAMGSLEDPESQRAVLLPALELLLNACQADPDGRFRLGAHIVQWAFAIAPTFFPRRAAAELRHELSTTLSRSLYCFPNTVITDPSAVVVAMCDRCFTPPGSDTVRLPGDQVWTAVRRSKRTRALLCPDARRLSGLEVQMLDVAHARLSLPQVLPRAAAAGGHSSPVGWFQLPATAPAKDVPGPTGEGRCQQCGQLTRDLHVLALRPLLVQTLPNIAQIG